MQLLGGSWVVMSPLIGRMTIVTLLITPSKPQTLYPYVRRTFMLYLAFGGVVIILCHRDRYSDI